MFLLSKMLKILFSPFHLTLFCLVLGAILRKLRFVKASRVALVLGFTGLILSGITPLGYNLMSWLENRVQAPQEMPQQVAGIIVLGGAIEPGISANRVGKGDDIAINSSAERLFAFMALEREYRESTIIYAGGSGSVSNQRDKESDYAKQLLERLGFPLKNVIFERESRNTIENVNNIKEIINGSQRKGAWMLVTSAYHMPRALSIFRDNGLEVVPYPVDYQTHGDYRWLPRPELLDNVYKLDVAFKEIAGLWVYKLSRNF
ncbi:MAG: YdcF family protein [Alphaproteobacteria bacterium]|nr:YdcF family protein [Alphaproteobacteria bacterium]